MKLLDGLTTTLRVSGGATFTAFAAIFVCASLSHGPTNNNQRLWFDYPAEHWNSQALHIGNGSLGASFYGGIGEEQFDVTEKSMWTGGPGEKPDYRYGIRPGGKEHAKEVRDAIVSGDVATSDLLSRKHFTGDYAGFGHLTMIGNLRVEFDDHAGACSEYLRELDLSKSLGRVSYKMDGRGYQREYFCSYPDRVMVMRFSADRPGTLGFGLRHDLVQKSGAVETVGSEMRISGAVDGNNRRYCVKIRVLVEGGSVAAGDDRLTVSGADAAVVIYAAATEYLPTPPNYKGADPDALTRSRVDAAAKKGYGGLKSVHMSDYQLLYDRVKLTLAGDRAIESQPTNKRWEALKSGHMDDAGLEVLLFNLGRYLIISASRPGSLPSHLQGAWNSYAKAPWNGNYQSNINLQEMYWPCGPVALLECQEAYIDWIEGLVVPGREVAREYYGTEGWVSHTTGNIWGYAAPGAGINWGLFPVGATWHCQHVWEQYAFSMDETYLKDRAYPIIKEAAQFWLANLVPYDGGLISAPTVSAEHGVQQKDGEYIDPTVGADAGTPRDGSAIRYTIPGSFQDIEMIHDLFTHAIEAADALGVDREFRDEVAKTRERLLPLRIGRYGQLQEWALDVDSPKDHHRHIAHLYAVHPGKMIHPLTTPDLAAAAQISLKTRGDGFAGPKWPYSGGNWARTWRIWCWARLLDGDRAHRIFNEMVVEQGFENLMTFQQVPGSDRMQVDGSMSTPGFMAEMLLQSHFGEIHLLPALPVAWPEGDVKGLCARGGFVVDMSWRNGKLKRAEIRSKVGGKCKVRYREKVVELATEAGKSYNVSID